MDGVGVLHLLLVMRLMAIQQQQTTTTPSTFDLMVYSPVQVTAARKQLTSDCG